MIVFDITNKKTFENAKTWIDELNENASLDILIALVANKADMVESRQISSEVIILKIIIIRTPKNLQIIMDYYILSVLQRQVIMSKRCL